MQDIMQNTQKHIKTNLSTNKLAVVKKKRCKKTRKLDSLESGGNYSATSNNMKLVCWPLMGGLLHLVQLGGD